MKPIKVMVNGQPGDMASKLASFVAKTEGFELVQYSLTGPEITQGYAVVDGLNIKLLPPAERNQIEDVAFYSREILVADFTHPDATVSNAQLYKNFHIPFIMGTTGGDREALVKTVQGSDISAVIAPNMASPIVIFMAMIKWAAETFPGAFDDFDVDLMESHQATKKDTSGTMLAMVKYLIQLGLNCSEDDIVKVRDRHTQLSMGVPESALGGHAFHEYTLSSPDGTTVLQFEHNVIGRNIYAIGAIKALRFLEKKVLSGDKGNVYSMTDVLKEKS